MVDLSIVVDDLGNFGCSQNCSASLIEPLLAHAHIQVWLVAPTPLTLGKSLKTTPTRVSKFQLTFGHILEHFLTRK